MLLASVGFLLIFAGCQRPLAEPSPTPSPVLEKTSTILESKRINDLDQLAQVQGIADLSGISTSSLPNNFNRIGADSPISVSFAAAMDKASVENAFAIAPKVRGRFEWQENTVTFYPETPYIAGKRYTVTLTNEALDDNGNNLPEKYQREFAVTGQLKILAIVPKNQEVAPNTDISIIFNQPIAELGTLDELENKDFGIEVTPPFPFRYRLAGTNTLQIQGQMPADSFGDELTLAGDEKTEHRLPRSSDLQFTIPADFKSLNGSTLGESVNFSLRTPQIQLVSEDYTTASPFAPLILAFTQPVDTASVQEATEVFDEQNKALELDFAYAVSTDNLLDETRVAVMPKSGAWQYDTKYMVRVAANIAGTEGNLATEENRIITFRTAAFASILSADEVAQIGPKSPLILAFDQPPTSLTAIKQSLSLANAPDFTLSYLQMCKDPTKRSFTNSTDCEKIDDRRRVKLTFAEPLENNNTYSLTIAAGLTATVETDDTHPEQVISLNWLNKSWKIPSPIELVFSVAPQPAVIGFDGKNGNYKEFCLYTNLPFDGKTITEAIRFSPPLSNPKLLTAEVGKVSEYVKADENGEDWGCEIAKHTGENFVLIKTGLAFETDYKITLLPSAQDIYGQKLEQEAVFEHRTKALQDDDIQITSVTERMAIAPFAGEPTVVFRSLNVPGEITIDICQTDIREIMRREGDLYNMYSDRTWLPARSSCEGFWQLNLPVTSVAWKDELATVSLKQVLGEAYEHGTYIVAAHHPRVHDTVYDTASPREKERYAFSILQVTDLALVTKTDTKKVTAWVSRMSDGNNVPNVMISTGGIDYSAFGKTTKFFEDSLGQTNEDGLLQAQLPADTKPYAVVLAEAPDGDRVLLRSYGFRVLSPEEETLTAYIFSDRPIYRPGDTVTGKAIFAYDHDADYTPASERDFVISVYDNKSEPLLENIPYVTNQRGALAYEFDLPSDMPLGNGELHFCLSSEEGPCFFSSIAIEEYKKPEFATEVTSAQKEYLQGQTAKITASAKYFFGLPVSDATAEYSLKREEYIFDRYSGEEGFRFSEEDFPMPYFARGGLPFSPPEYLSKISTELDANGEATFEQLLELPFKTAQDFVVSSPRDIRVPLAPTRRSQTYTAEVTVADHNKNPVYATDAFVALASGRFVGIKTDKWSVETGQPLTLKVVVVNANGEPEADQSVMISVIRQTEVEDPADEDNPQDFVRSHQEEELITSAEIITDITGKATYQFVAPEAKTGQYKLLAEVKDAEANLHRAATRVFVYDSSPIIIDPNQQERIELVPDKSIYHVGDTAQITVLSPLAREETKYLLAEERKLLHQSSVLQLPPVPVLTIPITEEMIPNMHLSLIGQQFGIAPRVASGTVDIVVDTAPKNIDVNIILAKESYQPGDTVTLDIEANNTAGSGEVAVVVVDKANLILLQSMRQKIMDFFWSAKPDYVQSAMTLLELGSKISGGDASLSKNKSAQRGFSPPMAPGAMGLAVSEEMMEGAGLAFDSSSGNTPAQIRADFKDTAFFAASIPLDEGGKAKVDFALPDNITTWEILVIAHDEQFHVGETTKEIIATRPLLLRPQVPRFVRFSDTIQVRADVTNESEVEIKSAVNLAAKNIALKGDAQKLVTLGAGETASVTWQLDASASTIGQAATLTFTATSDTFTDSVEQVVPILSYATPETVATSGVTTGASHYEKIRVPETVVPNLGSLMITTSATLANYLHSGLDSVLEYSYDSNEVSASRLLALTVYRRAMLIPHFEGHLPLPILTDQYGNTVLYDETIRMLIDNLQKAQRYDGGWGYWQESAEADFVLTGKILAAFAALREDGFSFDAAVAQNAAGFLLDHMQNKRDLGEEQLLDTTAEADARAFSLWTLARFGEGHQQILELTEALLAERKLLSIDGKINVVALLQTMGIENETKQSIISELTALLEVDPRGIFLSSEKNHEWYFSYSSAEERTARLSQILIRETSGSLYDNPFLPKMIMWLIRVRQNGQWGSNYATSTVLAALVEFLATSKEYDADYQATIFADGREIESYNVAGESLFDTHSVIIGTEDILERNPEGLIVQFVKEGSEQGALYYEMILKYFLPIAEVLAREEGISVQRNFYAPDDVGEQTPLFAGKIGDVLKGKIIISVADDRRYLVVDSPLAAGMELINFRLLTSDKTLLQTSEEPLPVEPFSIFRDEAKMPLSPATEIMPPERGIGTTDTSQKMASSVSKPFFPPIWYSPWTHTELKDDRLLLYADHLAPGVYEYEFFVRLTHAGEFALPPTRAEEMQAPEIFGRTAGSTFVVTD